MPLTENNIIYLTKSIEHIKKLQLIVYSTQHSRVLVRLSKTAKWTTITDNILIKFIIMNSKYATPMNTYELNSLWGNCFDCLDTVKSIVVDYVKYCTSTADEYEYEEYEEYMRLLNSRIHLTETETYYRIEKELEVENKTKIDIQPEFKLEVENNSDTDWDII